MNKIIIILGQTSTGKSDFAVQIAKEINGEIISADSRQVYKGMDLGTGKITKKEMKKIPHHLLDVVSPSRVFSVSDFKKQAEKKIKEIINKPSHPHKGAGGNKIPIICGGTGFYIDAVTNNTIFPEVPPNKKLRIILDKKTTEQLFEILKQLDTDRAKNIDNKNRVRLIRAIEIAKTLGKVPLLNYSYKSSSIKFGTNSAGAEFVPNSQNQNIKFEFLKIGLTLSPEILKERIKTRLLARIKKGMIKEVENLHKQGVSWKRMNDLGLEYRYVSLYLQNKINKNEMVEKLNTKIWHYAKRQKTWFKRDQSIIWIDPTKNKDKTLIIKKVQNFLK
jgi:tRNA dimethylallyltransferase